MSKKKFSFESAMLTGKNFHGILEMYYKAKNGETVAIIGYDFGVVMLPKEKYDKLTKERPQGNMIKVEPIDENHSNVDISLNFAMIRDNDDELIEDINMILKKYAV